MIIGVPVMRRPGAHILSPRCGLSLQVTFLAPLNALLGASVPRAPRGEYVVSVVNNAVLTKVANSRWTVSVTRANFCH